MRSMLDYVSGFWNLENWYRICLLTVGEAHGVRLLLCLIMGLWRYFCLMNSTDELVLNIAKKGDEIKQVGVILR